MSFCKDAGEERKFINIKTLMQKHVCEAFQTLRSSTQAMSFLFSRCVDFGLSKTSPYNIHGDLCACITVLVGAFFGESLFLLQVWLLIYYVL